VIGGWGLVLYPPAPSHQPPTTNHRNPMKSAADVVQTDLDFICDCLKDDLPKMRGKRILITGGAGFLGHYLVQTITHANRHRGLNAKLTVYDNLSRGAPGWLNQLVETKQLSLVQHDMRMPLPKDLGEVDFIVHAASIASPIYYRKDPIGTMDANVNGLRNLLEHSKKQGETGHPVAGFLFYSSSEIYGDPDPANIPTREDYRGLVSCTGPRACYDEAKRYGETLCANFARQHGLQVTVARPFNNYGPGLKITDGRVIPDFARDVLNGRDIVMLSDGKPMRTFCYAADAIVGYYKVLLRGEKGEAFNIGIETPEISMGDLARKLVSIAKDLFGYTGKVITQQSKDSDYLVDNPNRRCPVIEKARTKLGFNPQISLDEGLKRTLIWYSGNMDAEEK
jgi:nucleoside-diphosphate-sugar epimerase